MGKVIPGTGMYYTGDPRDIMRGEEVEEKFVRLFEPMNNMISDERRDRLERQAEEVIRADLNRITIENEEKSGDLFYTGKGK